MPRNKMVGRSIAIVIHEGTVLLVASKVSPGSWVPPGGTIEPREDAADCVAREVLEETGVRINVTGLIACRQVWWPGHDSIELYFSAEPAEAVTGRLTTGEERRPAKWEDIEALGRVPHFPEMLNELCELARGPLAPARLLPNLDLRDKKG